MFGVCLCARFQKASKTSYLEAVKHIFRYIKGTTHLGLWYPKGTCIETVVYDDSNHAGDYVDQKSTSGICTFVGCCLTSWFLKKQTALAISTTEAEYVSIVKSCQQALWMKQALIDYDVRLDDVPIMCDNKGVIDLSKNPVQLSRTKHIEIRHHFLRDNVQKGHISIEKESWNTFHKPYVSVSPSSSFDSSPCSIPCRDNLNTSSEEIMPRKSSEDHKNTRAYIPMISHEYRTPIKEKLRDLESRYIHEGRVVFNNFADLNYVRSLLHFIEFECLLEINEQIYPRFILEFYSQYRVSYSDEGTCVFTDRWRLDELAYGIPSDGPYQTNLPSIEDIILSIRIDRDVEPTLKPLEEIIRENVFCLRGNRDHVPACLCYMLYCVVHSERFNLAYFMAKRMEWVTKQKRLILPYGMLLTRLFTFIMNEYPKLNNESYVLYDCVMTPLAAQLERKPRRDRGTRRGRHSTSFSSAFDQPSSFYLNDDDDDGNDEGSSRESTPSPIHYVNSLTNQVP
ncbi:hypothetical protein Tco_0888179 [Tanacetum coccineum]